MKRKSVIYFLKRMLAILVSVSVLITEQSIVYAAEANDVQEETLNIESPAELEIEESKSGDSAIQETLIEKPLTVITEKDTWHPKVMSFQADEAFLMDQPLILVENEEEEYVYEESYGKQLMDTLSGDLYKALKSCWNRITEETENQENDGEEGICVGEFTTPTSELQGDSYEIFYDSCQKNAQYAFDAFYYDEADAEYINFEKSGLQITYTGNMLEDGSYMWSAEAVWDLDLNDFEETDDIGVEDYEESDTEETVYEKLVKFYDQTLELLNLDELSEDEKCARMYKRFCEREGIECVLVDSVLDGRVIVWNEVYIEDEGWYAVDVLRSIFLEGSDNLQKSMAEINTYGDFSNSHNGFFAIPKLMEADYNQNETYMNLLTEEDCNQNETYMNLLAEEDSADEVSDPVDEQSVEEVADEGQVDETEISEEPVSEDIPVALSEDDGLFTSRMMPVQEEKRLTQVSVSSIKTQVYTGKAIMPKVAVKDNVTKKNLKAGKQYTVSYENNVNAGTATVVIRGIENSGYDGVLRVNFTIQPQNIAKKVSSKIIGKKFYYTGQEVTPGVDLSYNRVPMIQGRDYQVSYQNNIAKGSAQICLTGIGNFTGTKILKYKITAKNIKEAGITLSSSSDVFSGENKMPSVITGLNGLECKENVDYIVKYPKKLKVGKNIIMVRGRGNFSGSLKLTYYLSKSSLTGAEIYFPYAWQYTKKTVKVQPSSVVLDGTVLRAKKDYTIKYRSSSGKISSSVKNTGIYQIILTGKGNYQGTVTFPFCITDSQEQLNSNYNSAESTIKKEEPEVIPPVVPDTSPGETVPVEKDRYWGYYEGYKITSKKGIQGVSDYTEDTRAQHVLLNVNMADMISTVPRSGYISYVYKGKTYYFGDLIALKETIYYLHGWGDNTSNPYGSGHMRSVTLVLLMGWKDELSYLIHPSARKKGAASYYALNMQDSLSRDTFEALFRYMGEELGQYKTRVSNWTLGNEVNSCKEWNYSGSMSLQDCVANYAQAFQLLYRGVKRAATSSRVFISLDHCWNALVAGHSGKAFLDQFASYMNHTAPDMQWNVNYHPYSQPLSNVDFWNDNSNTTDSVGTKYISMKNIHILTGYLAGIETKYGKSSNSIRVIIGELGYTAKQGNKSSEDGQAAALGYGYYIAMFNTRIDAYIIRAYLDAPEEMASGLYLGLMNTKHVKKASYDVYKNLDTEQSLDYMNQYLSTIGVSSWESVISGFDKNALQAVGF